MLDLAHYRQRLEARLDELTRRLHTIEHDLDQPVSPNWDEAAAEREDDEALEELGAEGLKEVRAIRAALARLEAGSYGTCAECGGDIAIARLDAVPHAALCSECARD
jgi:RNA polymerase-binding protein DksA